MAPTEQWSVLRELRRDAGLSQEELAERCGMSARAIRKLENGQVSRPHRRTLATLGDVLGLDETARETLSAQFRSAPTAPHAGSGGPSRRSGHGQRVVPNQLPSAPPRLAGRATDLSDLLDGLTGDFDRGPAVVCGLGGIGKSALAFAAGRELVDRFPDGLLFALLSRPDGTDRDAMEVIGEFLRALGVDDVPDSDDERVNLWRSVTAASRLLLVLDDAVDERQVRPLAVGGNCRTIITSRNPLGGLDAGVRLRLRPLDDVAAVEVLQNETGRDADELLGLVSPCAGVPLALRLLGARLALAPHMPGAELARRLGDERERLDELASGDRSVRDGVARSIRLLTPRARRCLISLAGLQLPEFGEWVVHALGASGPAAPVTSAASARELEELVSLGLVEVTNRGAASARYRLHDLVRLYARDDGAITAVDMGRVATWATYLAAASVDGRIARPTPHALWSPRPDALPPATACDIVGSDPGLWFESEWINLVTIARGCVRSGLHEDAAGLLGAIRMPMTRSGRVRALRDLARECGHQGSVLARACAHLTVATVDAELGQYREAAATLAETLPELADADACTLAGAWHELGWVSVRLGDLDAAADAYERARELHSSIGNSYGELAARTGLVEVWIGAARAGEVGRIVDARHHAEIALGMLVDVPDHRSAANLLITFSRIPELGTVWRDVVDALPDALATARERGDQLVAMRCLTALAEADLTEGAVDGALECAVEAVALGSTRGWPADLAAALTQLGHARLATGAVAAARSSWTEALDLRDSLGHVAAAESLRSLLAADH